MSETRQKLKSMFGEPKRRAIISACVMIAVALAMLFTALCAHFQYFSDRDVLHLVYVEIDDVGDETEEDGDVEDGTIGEEATVIVNETRRVKLSLFRLFEAVTVLGDASTLHAASHGEIYDQEDYDKARERLTKLREEYAEIVAKTVKAAAEKGIAQGSEEYVDLLADNLSEMNLAALDMLETAFASDNDGAYETVYGGLVLALFVGIINLLIVIIAIVAIIFSVVWLVTKSQQTKYLLFFAILTGLSTAGLLMCVFNTIIPPAACPLALACIAVLTFFVAGTLRAVVIGDAPVMTIVRNCVAAALVSAGTLALAAVPSLNLYVKGVGMYPGTVGTVHFSHLKAMHELGLEIPSGAITSAFTFGIIVAALSLIATVVALDRLYQSSKNKGGLFSALLGVIAVFGIVLCAVVTSASGKIGEQGIIVKYIVGACWYVNLAFMIATAAMFLAFCVFKLDKIGAGKTHEEKTEEPENELGQDRTEEETKERIEQAEEVETKESEGKIEAI